MLIQGRKCDLIVLGASGHGRVIADIAKLCGFKDIVFLDDDERRVSCGGYPVLGSIGLARKMEGPVFAAVGDSEVRQQLMEALPDRVFATLVHPKAVVSHDSEIGAGSVVMAGAVVNPGARIGKGCIVNTCASVDHDCVMGDYSHISVGAHLCGTVNIGEHSFVGAGAVVCNNLKICGHSTVGAGAVVIRDITEEGTYCGVPARRINNEG